MLEQKGKGTESATAEILVSRFVVVLTRRSNVNKKGKEKKAGLYKVSVNKSFKSISMDNLCS